jgi:hypothetical protein
MTERNEAVNEIEQLEAMCAAVPPPDEVTLARARARVLGAAGDSASDLASDSASGAAGRGKLAQRGPGRGRLARGRLITVPQLALTGGFAVAAAAAVTAVLVSTAAPGPAPGVRLDAAAVVLHRAAAAALAAPAPRPGQFLYIDVRAVGSRGENLYQQQMWLPASNGFHPGTVVQTPCALASGRQCTMVDPQVRGDWAAPTYAWVSTLPSDPGVLLTDLENHSVCAFSTLPADTPHAAYSEVYNILNSVYVLPPAAGAALFNAAAEIPGVTVLRHVTDAAGGQGIAVVMTGRATPAAPAQNPPLGPVLRYELIFNPHTYRLIGLQEVTPEGAVEHAEAVISAQVAGTARKTSSHFVWTGGGWASCIV